MKITIVGLFIILGLMYFIMGDNLIVILSDLSSILFFGFATISMIAISALIAIDTAKSLNYKILNNEYENLKDELHNHITRNVYSIEISKEASLKYNEYKQLEKKINDLKGENYES